MDPLAINTSTFTLKQGTNSFPGSVTYSGKTGTFTPSESLAAVTKYTATVNAGAKNYRGILWLLTLYGVSQPAAILQLLDQLVWSNSKLCYTCQISNK